MLVAYLDMEKRRKGACQVSYAGGYGAGGGFALVVVLFILLIIIGASYVGGGYGY